MPLDIRSSLTSMDVVVVVVAAFVVAVTTARKNATAKNNHDRWMDGKAQTVIPVRMETELQLLRLTEDLRNIFGT